MLLIQNPHNLSLTSAGGKTLTINGNIAVKEKLSLSGGGISNRLKINGSGKISLAKPHNTPDPSRDFYKLILEI